MVRRSPLLLVALIAGLFAAGYVARDELGIEFSRESVESLVSGLGWKAPAIFVGLVSFRQFLGLPSMLILSAGGAVFGAGAGTALGALGILISASFGYTVARGAGRDWLRGRLGARADDFQRRAGAAGPFVVGVVTAHPAGPMTPFHWGAGFASVPVIPFLVGVAMGSPVRAFLYSFFGSTLFEPGTQRFLVASVALVAVALLLLAHRGTRRRLLGAVRSSAAADARIRDGT